MRLATTVFTTAVLAATLAVAPRTASAQALQGIFDAATTAIVNSATQPKAGAPAAAPAPVVTPQKVVVPQQLINVPAPKRGDGGAAAAAGVIGLASGLIAAGIAQQAEEKAAADAVTSEQAHIDSCLKRYKSYNPRTDTYIGPDGQRHQCR